MKEIEITRKEVMNLKINDCKFCIMKIPKEKAKDDIIINFKPWYDSCQQFGFLHLTIEDVLKAKFYKIL